MQLTLKHLTSQFDNLIESVTDKRGTKTGLVITLKPGFSVTEIRGAKLEEVATQLGAVAALPVIEEAAPEIPEVRPVPRRSGGVTKSIINRAATFMRAAQNAYSTWGQYIIETTTEAEVQEAIRTTGGVKGLWDAAKAAYAQHKEASAEVA